MKLVNLFRRITLSIPSSVRWVLVLLTLWIALLVCIPMKSVLQIGADEGFELAKATEMLHGHQLYTGVWNDQPPLHTVLVARILRDFPQSILRPRLLTVALATLLWAAAFVMVLRLSGIFSAVAASGFLIASPGFIELSSSCMLEIPALAFAVLAVCLLSMNSAAKWRAREILAGVFLGIAMQFKLTAAILAPVAALVVWLQSGADGLLRSKTRFLNAATSIALITISVAVTFVALDWAMDRGSFLRNFQQSWSSHFATPKSFEYGSASDHPFDWTILLKHWDTTAPALLGLYFLFRRREGRLLIPVIWLALELLVFAIHTPWWSYYYVHIAVPLCWLAGVGIASAAQIFHPVGACKSTRLKVSPPAYPRHALGRVVLVLFAFCAFGWLSGRVYLQISDIRKLPRISSTLVLQDIARFQPFASLLYADESIYSFYAGIPMPPNLAVAPLKRFWAGDMTNARLAAELQAAKPELMLLKNDARERPFSELIAAEYQLVYEDGRHRLFVRRDIVKRVPYLP